MRIFFFGNGPIAQHCLQTILNRSPRHTLCGMVGSPGLLNTENLKDSVLCLPLDPVTRGEDKLLQAIHQTKPDVVLSVQYPWILSSRVIEALDGKIINLHNGKLPDYRGHHSISHALLNRETTYTSTLHWIAPEVDRGRCIDTEIIEIFPGDTAKSLWSRSIGACIALVERLLDRAQTTQDIPYGSPIGSGGRFYSRTMLDSLKRVSVDASADQMALIARACHFPPYEPAYIDVGGPKIYLLAGDYHYHAN